MLPLPRHSPGFEPRSVAPETIGASTSSAGAALAVLMVVLGLAASFVTQNRDLGTPKADPGFFSVQLIDMIEFGGLVVAAIWVRNQPIASGSDSRNAFQSASGRTRVRVRVGFDSGFIIFAS